MKKQLLPMVIALLGLSACSEKPDGPATPHPGEALVKANCAACHKPGLNGAPIIGNEKMWQPRIVQGEEVLVQHAINDFGLMPPRGGSSLSDEQLALAVNYMLSRLPPTP